MSVEFAMIKYNPLTGRLPWLFVAAVTTQLEPAGIAVALAAAGEHRAARHSRAHPSESQHVRRLTGRFRWSDVQRVVCGPVTHLGLAEDPGSGKVALQLVDHHVIVAAPLDPKEVCFPWDVSRQPVPAEVRARRAQILRKARRRDLARRIADGSLPLLSHLKQLIPDDMANDALGKGTRYSLTAGYGGPYDGEAFIVRLERHIKDGKLTAAGERLVRETFAAADPTRYDWQGFSYRLHRVLEHGAFSVSLYGFDDSIRYGRREGQKRSDALWLRPGRVIAYEEVLGLLDEIGLWTHTYLEPWGGTHCAN